MHLADLAPGMISAELGILRRVARLWRSELGEPTPDEEAEAAEALGKWIRWKFPRASATPTGALLLSQGMLVMGMVLNAKRLERGTVLQMPAPSAAAARTAAPSSPSAGTGVQSADGSSQSSDGPNESAGE
jgi:hypothetical protein